ncbi:hypothetical protein [Paracoccus lutimaris]|uniref:Uncharacterized protein n=1 Tax=Paracoccus lutimaris TaxID=1490030 RepID=A0A368Z169_9RHOB|nr:hypothetical protein [Paracoccus lutimaris]RCW84194.1 hypothetical protein DFP89_108141 [Paracoccus lutimaris]
MTSEDYANIVLFAAARRKQGAFDKFRSFFRLLRPDPGTAYEITDWKSGEMVHEESSLESAVGYLDANPELCFDFYLSDPDENIFTFSYRPVGHHVMSIPYGLLSVVEIKAFIKEFDILYAWGTGEDSPPPDDIEEIYEASGCVNSPFVRYRDGKLLLGRELIR